MHAERLGFFAPTAAIPEERRPQPAALPPVSGAGRGCVCACDSVGVHPPKTSSQPVIPLPLFFPIGTEGVASGWESSSFPGADKVAGSPKNRRGDWGGGHTVVKVTTLESSATRVRSGYSFSPIRAQGTV